MNQSQLLGLLRRYIKESWSKEERRLRDTSAYYGRKAEYDGALKAIALLEAIAYQQQQDKQQQTTLGGER